jgi:hypothetical protein
MTGARASSGRHSKALSKIAYFITGSRFTGALSKFIILARN